MSASRIVVLTGGTGFVGKELVSQLTSRGYRVRILTRDPDAARAAMMGFSADFYRWNPTNEDAPAQALEGAWGVIHLAGESVSARWTASRKARIRDSRIIGTRHLVQGLKRLSQRPQSFVSTSAIGFYGDRGNETLTEHSSPGEGFLAEVCQGWEAEARAFGEGLSIVRVGIVLGRKGGALARMLPLFRAGLGGPLGDGRQWMSWIHLQDLAALYIYALENPKGVRLFNGVAPTPVTNAQFTRVLGRVLHRPALLPAPALALKLALGEMASMILGSQRAVPEAARHDGFVFRFENLDTALGDLLMNRRAAAEVKRAALPG